VVNISPFLAYRQPQNAFFKDMLKVYQILQIVVLAAYHAILINIDNGYGI
jgi:hypothetical protein